MMRIEEIEKLPPKEAIEILTDLLEKDPKNEDALVLRGQKYWSLNLRKEAMGDYLAALKLNPESKAKMLLAYAESILSFYHKDLLNP